MHGVAEAEIWHGKARRCLEMGQPGEAQRFENLSPCPKVEDFPVHVSPVVLIEVRPVGNSQLDANVVARWC